MKKLEQAITTIADYEKQSAELAAKLRTDPPQEFADWFAEHVVVRNPPGKEQSAPSSVSNDNELLHIYGIWFRQTQEGKAITKKLEEAMLNPIGTEEELK
jgi:hypothetical protein